MNVDRNLIQSNYSGYGTGMVAPGAGFSESAQFLHLTLTGPDAPPAWEQQLYHLPDDDLYLLGLTSHATVNVMLALEDEFEIEFPEQGGSVVNVVAYERETGERSTHRRIAQGRKESPALENQSCRRLA